MKNFTDNLGRIWMLVGGEKNYVKQRSATEFEVEKSFAYGLLTGKLHRQTFMAFREI